MFSGDDLNDFLDLADYACFNDYEAQLACDRTGQSLESLAKKVTALIVTRGGEGSWIFAAGQRHEIPCVMADAVVDPTGCGDAYRAGLLYGITRGWNWVDTGRLAAVMGQSRSPIEAGRTAPSREEIAVVSQTPLAAAPGKLEPSMNKTFRRPCPRFARCADHRLRQQQIGSAYTRDQTRQE